MQKSKHIYDSDHLNRRLAAYRANSVDSAESAQPKRWASGFPDDNVTAISGNRQMSAAQAPRKSADRVRVSHVMLCGPERLFDVTVVYSCYGSSMCLLYKMTTGSE